jgi:hypothetical protein
VILSLRSLTPIAAVVALAWLAPPAMADAPAAHTTGGCFSSTDWSNWTSPSPKVIYLRVHMRDIYRLDLSVSSEMLQEPGTHLVDFPMGSDWVCSPLDLNLSVAEDQGGMKERLFVASMTKLTPDQIQAIPRKDLP